jgi:hypothetical protein
MFKLYVYRDVLWDYTDGMIAILARSQEEANYILPLYFGEYDAEEIVEKGPTEVVEIEGLNEPKLFFVHGGG